MHSPRYGFGDCRMRHQPTNRSRRSGPGGRPERRRLENHQTAPGPAIRRSAKKLAALYFAALLSGCVSNSFTVQNPAPPRAARSLLLAPEVLLEVNDGGVIWGAGKIGEGLKTALVKNRTFGEVHFPIYPTRPVPIKLHVLAHGEIKTDAGDGAAKSIITGLFLFLPAGVLQYKDTFTINAEVSVFREDRKLGTLTVESQVAADHHMFAGADSYATQAGQMAIEDFAARLSSAMAGHPAWFSP